MDTKSLRLEIKSEARGEVSAIFSTFDVVDSDNEVTRPGAFEDGAPVVISAYGHTSWNGALPVGKGAIRQTRTEAVFEGRFFMDTQHGADTFRTVAELAKSGLGEWSYGFDVLKEAFGDHQGKRVRFLEKIKTFEVSPVLRGAGIGTRTLATKNGPGHEPLTAAELAVFRTAQAHVADLEREERAIFKQAQAHVAGYLLEQALGRARACLRELDELKASVVSWYVELTADDVPLWKRAIAEVAASKYSTELGYSLPVVRWFRDETTAERHYLEIYGEPASKGFGWTGKGWLQGMVKAAGEHEVWLNAGMNSAADIDAIAAHEVRHLAGGDEAQAQAYERRAREQYWSLEGVA